MQTTTIAVPTNALNWFAIPAEHFDRAAQFYQTIFEMTLNVHDFAGERIGIFPSASNGVGGCVTSGKPSVDGTIIYLNADGRLDRTLELVTAAGGTIDRPKAALPNGMGWSAHIRDTEGNVVGLHANT